jgi:hypothetical protein
MKFGVGICQVTEIDLVPRAGEIVEQITELEAQGLVGINFVTPIGRQWQMCDEFERDAIECYSTR